MKLFVKHYFAYDVKGCMQEVFVEGYYENSIINIIETRTAYINDKSQDIITFDKKFTMEELEKFISENRFYPEQKEAYLYALDYLKRAQRPT